MPYACEHRHTAWQAVDRHAARVHGSTHAHGTSVTRSQAARGRDAVLMASDACWKRSSAIVHHDIMPAPPPPPAPPRPPARLPAAPFPTDGGVLVGASSRSNGEPLRRPLVRRHLLLLTCVSSTVPSSADVDNTGASTRRRSRLALSRFEKDRTQAAFPPCFLVLAFRRAEVLLFRGIPYPRGTLWLG